MGRLETSGAMLLKAENLIDHDGPTDTWGFLKIRGTILAVPIIRIIIFWGPHWDPPIYGNYHMTTERFPSLHLQEEANEAEPPTAAFPCPAPS